MAKMTCNVISYILKRTVEITVIIPTPTVPDALRRAESDTPCRHTPKAKYPVLYLLHGSGNNNTTWTGYTNVELFAEEQQIAIVNIAAENKRYIKYGVDDFFRFLSEEVPDFVCGLFPVSDKPEDTYIAGLSMGGYGTLLHALSFPERFAALGALSASVKRVPIESVLSPGFDPEKDETQFNEPEYDLDCLAEKVAAEGRRFPKVYMACGGKDFWLGLDKQFRDKLISLGADVTWEELPEYAHEWRFWNVEIEKFLEWLPRTDYYAKLGKRTI